jgi:hypothetical protein
MYETRSEKVISAFRFAWRMAVHVSVSIAVVVGALILGIAGYRWFAGFTWIDATLNASMILAGMGPVGELHSNAAKLFASAYALFSGFVFLFVAGITLAPLFHRIIHTFHLDDCDAA